MSKKNEQTPSSGRCPVGSVGGQAVMEGVMMQSPDKIAMAVRRPDGKVVLRVRERKILAKRYPILGWPIIRGVVNFVYQLYDGMKTLTASAEIAGGEVEEPSRFEKKVAKVLHMKPEDVMMVFAVVLAIALSILLFFVLPTGLEALIKKVVSSRVLLNIIGGLIRIGGFLL